MNYKLKSLLTIVVFLCGCLVASAQTFTADQHHFTLPPRPIPTNPDTANVASPAIPPVPVRPTILSFDQKPSGEWTTWDCTGQGSAQFSHGILTINSPNDCFEFDLFYPTANWNQFASNSRGWVVETSLKVDPRSDATCGWANFGSVVIWANDHTNLIIVGFSTDQVCIVYPEEAHFYMDTTNSFHVYRLENRGNHLRIYVDGSLAIDHYFSWFGSGSQVLYFGDGTGSGSSFSQWDYFSYDVFPLNPIP
jgi:hypothetical protein